MTKTLIQKTIGKKWIGQEEQLKEKKKKGSGNTNHSFRYSHYKRLRLKKQHRPPDQPPTNATYQE